MFEWVYDEETSCYDPYVLTFDEDGNSVGNEGMDMFRCDSEFPAYNMVIFKRINELLDEGNVITEVDGQCISYTAPDGEKFVDSVWLRYIDENGDEWEVLL